MRSGVLISRRFAANPAIHPSWCRAFKELELFAILLKFLEIPVDMLDWM
jgi:hypothetical protein